MNNTVKPESPLFAFKDDPRWAPVEAFYDQLGREKRSPQAKTALARIGWAIATLDGAGASITAAAIGKLCVDTWGGPKAQSIANDQDGYSKLVSLAKAAQSLPAKTKAAQPAGEDLLSRIADPMARAEVQLMIADLSGLKSQVATLRAGMRRVEALGPITAALAQHRIESLEQLNAILQQSKQPLGTSFTADEIASVTDFLANLESEGYAVNEDSGEIFNRSGRRNAGPGFIHALRKIATSGN